MEILCGNGAECLNEGNIHNENKDLSPEANMIRLQENGLSNGGRFA
jgi:hypothetical protein